MVKAYNLLRAELILFFVWEKDPQDVLRPFLLNMKQLLSIDSIKIYLLAENVINDDDLVRLTITPLLSKSDALINLRDIIRSRNVLDNFLNALKRSSIDDKNPGHKELFEMISKERERRLSMMSHEGDVLNPEINNIVQETVGNHTEPCINDQESGDNEPGSAVATQESQTDEHVMELNDSAVVALIQEFHCNTVSQHVPTL